jgi:hypothetical protein
MHYVHNGTTSESSLGKQPNITVGGSRLNVIKRIAYSVKYVRVISRPSHTAFRHVCVSFFDSTAKRLPLYFTYFHGAILIAKTVLFHTFTFLRILM